MDKNALRAVLEELVAMSSEPRRRELRAMAGSPVAATAPAEEDDACDVDALLEGVDCGDEEGKEDQKKRRVT